MLPHFVDFRLFQYALTSAEHSFRRAAAALNLQQSTVSGGIRNLEHRVGAKLFERTHAGIGPTPAGDRFLQEAPLGFDHLRRAMRQAVASQRGEDGELTVGASVPFTLFGELFERFREKHASVSLEIVENTTSANSALVQQRRVDVAIVAKLHENRRFQSLHVGEEPMLAVLPRSHSQAGARRLNIDKLQQETFILSAGGLGPGYQGLPYSSNDKVGHRTAGAAASRQSMRPDQHGSLGIWRDNYCRPASCRH